MTDSHPLLPGMAVPEPATTPMEVAARAVLDQLRAEGSLQPEHALIAQLVLDLSRAVGRSSVNGRGSAVALASRELRETMALLPKGGRDALSQLLADLDDEPTTIPQENRS